MKKHPGEAKNDNLFKVFCASLDRRTTSRTAICEDTGLSFVTVDKAVNTLVDADILKQSLSSKSAAVQRRSRMLSVKSSYWIAVYAIFPKNYRFYICDLSLRCIKEYVYTPEDTIFIDDTLNDFLRRTSKFAQRNVNVEKCCASGILVMGDYNEEDDTVYSSPINHIRAIRVKKFFSRACFNTEPQVMSVYSAFANEVSRCSEQNRSTYSLFLSRYGIHASYITPTFVSEIKDLSRLKASNNKTFERLVRVPPDPDDLFYDLCHLLYSLANSIPIDSITVCDSLYNNKEAVCSVMNNIMNSKYKDENIPEILPVDLMEYAVKYISREIRERWFWEKILTDKA